MPKLTITEGEKKTVYEILDEVVSIGRREGVSVRLADSHVGSEHCEIRQVPGAGYKLIDLESRNGTKVNGQFVNQHLLCNGDEILLGAVRITFSGEGAKPAAAARPAAVARPAVARPAATRPAVARPAASRAPREREREPFVRRSSAGSNAPIIVLGVCVGMLLFLLAAYVFISPWYEHTKNQNIYFDMKDLQREGRYEQALELAKQVEPTGDLEYYEKVQQLIEDVKADIRGRDLNAAGDSAQREFYALESWIQKHKEDTAGIATRWEAYIEKHRDTFWGNQAQIRLDELMGKGGGVVNSGASLDTGGQAKIDRSFRLALASAKVHGDRDAFGQARDVIEDFWEKNALLAEDTDAWLERKEQALRQIEERAEQRWQIVDEMARGFVDKGEYDKAFNLYKEVRKTFGLEKYQTLAKLAMQKITDGD